MSKSFRLSKLFTFFANLLLFGIQFDMLLAIMDTTTLIIVIVVLLLLFGGGGGYWYRRRR